MRKRPSSAARVWLLLAVPGLVWGASFLFIAEALESIGPSGVAFVRILLGFGTLACFPAARRPIGAGDSGRIALLGVLWMAFPLSMFPFAEQRVSSAVTGMLNGAIPLFTAVVASVLARRLPPRHVAIGLGVGMLGAGMVAAPSLDRGGSSAAGVLLILAAIVSYGFAMNVARPLQLRHGSLAVIWRALAVALVLTAPLGVPDLMRAQWTPVPLLSLLALGTLGTGVAYVVAATAAGELGATRASTIAFLIPPVALALGVLVRGESVSWVSAAGCAICVLGAWLTSRPAAIPLKEKHEGSTELRAIEARAV